MDLFIGYKHPTVKSFFLNPITMNLQEINKITFC